MERFGDTTYKLQDIKGGRPQIVHFDRLKPCPPDIRLPDDLRPAQIQPREEVAARKAKPGEHCKLIEDDGDDDLDAPGAPPDDPPAGHGDQPAPVRRYPSRDRRLPDRYGPYVEH